MKLSSIELADIDANSKTTDRILNAINAAKQFRVNDYVLCIVKSSGGSLGEFLKNSYKAPRKFKVIHVSDENIAFVREMDSCGRFIGEIFSLADWQLDEIGLAGYEHRIYEWVLDPDYADALILGDEYDPSVSSKDKKAMFKEITKHNKSIKINTRNKTSLINFFKSLKINDTIWTSNNNSLVVTDISHTTKHKAESLRPVNAWEPIIRCGHRYVVFSVVDKNGKVKKILIDHFFKKALYKGRPRSYKELIF